MKSDDHSLDPATVAGQIAALSPEKRKLLQRKLQDRVLSSPRRQSIPPRKYGTSTPLSFAQQRLWFFDQFKPGSPIYNMPCGFRLRGPLDPAVLQKSINEIVRRHEVLRTTFVSIEGEPIQAIAPHPNLTLEHLDLREIPQHERDSEALRLAAEERQRPFDLAAAPPVRGKLLRMGAEDHIALLTVHHIAADGWSMTILFRELAEIYNAFSMGKPSPLNELPIQYADYAVWQRQSLQGKVLEEQLSYWKKQLDELRALEFPTDRLRPAVQTFTGARRSLPLSRDLTRRLRALSRQNRATLFMTLLAAFYVLLQRYTRQNDIVIGSPIAGRTHEETEGLIGFFVNSLVLRADLSGNPTLRQLLDRVRTMALDAYAHQDLPFDKLVEELQPKRDLSRTPLFQVFLNMLALDAPELRLQGLTVEQLALLQPESYFDFTCYVKGRNEDIRLELVYNTALFHENTADRLLRHFETLLESLVGNPDQRLSELAMLTPGERETLLVEWNATQATYPQCCVHELFEAQAERTPDALAVVCEGQRLTYSELNRRAEQAARHLRTFGAKPGVLVGICMERSADLVVGLLGILKAGGAYLPIDPAYPAQRIAFMIEDSAMTLLLTQERLRGNLPESKCRVVSVESLAQPEELGVSHAATESAVPESLAYVIYTSGSTGRAKGVEIQHKALVNFLHSMRQRPGLTHQDILLSVTTISFDIAGLELFLPLIVGARVVVVSREVAMDGKRLVEQLENSGATVMQATPTTWRMLVEHGWSGGKNLKILSGGEVLSEDLVQAISERGGSLWNLYGPTETTVWSTVWEVEANYNRICIGRPIANTQTYILDPSLTPVPVGVAGELYIGGAGLARGYLNRPEITAESFVNNPFSHVPGSKLYKTGDLVRYLPDGNIEFLDRIDYQVKVRGFRIEPGEIEAVLREHAGIQQAVVVAREDVAGDKCLVDYVVLNPGFMLTTSELHRFLKSKLPDYMIPYVFISLDRLPITPNGKLDRKALPAPEQDRPEPSEGFVPPRNPTEEAVAKIWAKVLRLERVGVRDNFFDLGGHSLLATQVLSRIRRTFAIEIPLRSLFDNATVEELALQIAEIQARKSVPDEVAELLSNLESLSDEEAERLGARHST
jgi:amino acid adenylation domain-containing protein